MSAVTPVKILLQDLYLRAVLTVQTDMHYIFSWPSYYNIWKSLRDEHFYNKPLRVSTVYLETKKTINAQLRGLHGMKFVN